MIFSTKHEVLYRLRERKTPEQSVVLNQLVAICDARNSSTDPVHKISYHVRSLIKSKMIDIAPGDGRYSYYITQNGLAFIEPHLEMLAKQFVDRQFPPRGMVWAAFKRQDRPEEKRVKPYALPSGTVPMGSLAWWLAHFFAIDAEFDKYLETRGEELVYDDAGAAHIVKIERQLHPDMVAQIC